MLTQYPNFAEDTAADIARIIERAKALRDEREEKD